MTSPSDPEDLGEGAHVPPGGSYESPGGGFTPPPGFDERGEEEFHPPGPRPLPDLSAILAILDAVRAAVPRELQAQFTALLREVLLGIRALIDRYLERLDGRPTRTRVEDIPID